eukprot:m.23393 g.23393  ORF g.23393 m.23393 type:complete len:256 (-) comp11377_c0_seq1:108-875(-)
MSLTAIFAGVAGVATVGYGLIQCTSCLSHDAEDYSTFIVNPEAFKAAPAEDSAPQEALAAPEQAVNVNANEDANVNEQSGRLGFSASADANPEVFKSSKAPVVKGSAASYPRANSTSQSRARSQSLLSRRGQDLSARLPHSMPRGACEKILSATPVGSYLIRYRAEYKAKEKAYAISIRLGNGTITHVQLYHDLEDDSFTVTQDKLLVPNCTSLHQAVHALSFEGSSHSLLGNGSLYMRIIIYNNRQAGRLPDPG